MTFKELFKKTSEQLGEKNILCKFFLSEIIREMNKVPSNSPDWQNTEIDQEYAAGFYEYSLGKLWDMAVRLAHDSEDRVYNEATEIANMLRDVLNNEFRTNLPEARIISPTKAMVEQGLLEVVKNEDGEKFVKLTEKAEGVVKEVEKQIEESKQKERHKNN